MAENNFYEELVKSLPYLERYAYVLTSDTEKAKELIQETSVRALTFKEKYRRNENFKGWIATIMYHTFVNNYRKELRINLEDNYSLYNYHYTDTFNEEREILESINSLPAEYNRTFTLYMSGYKYCEIATKLSLPIGTVKSRIHIARKYLQKKLSR